MLRNLKEMEHLTVAATDGIVGRVRDFYFDDHSWVIRYLVVETREKLPRRRVLISPIAAGQPDWMEKSCPFPVQKSKSKPAQTLTPTNQCPANRRWGISVTTGTVPIGEVAVSGEAVSIRTSCRGDYWIRGP